MLNRRNFIQSGVALSALALNGVARAASNSLREETVPLYKIIIDSSFGAAISFGEEVRRHGIPIQQINDDLTQFWYEELQPLWKTKPLAIGGLTSAVSMRCLEVLAQRERARIIYSDHHSYKNTFSSAFQAFSEFNGVSLTWGIAAAQKLINQPRKVTGIVRKFEQSDIQKGELFSWIIAPVRLG